MGNENADNERKKHHRGRRRKKKGNIIANVILVIALIVFCVSGFQLFKIEKVIWMEEVSMIKCGNLR